MFKNTGTYNSNLCFSLIIIWHILWLKRGSKYVCAKFMPMVVYYVGSEYFFASL